MDSQENNRFFDASFERLIHEFVVAESAARNARKYRGTNSNAGYAEFCNERVTLLMSLLQFYRKSMTEIEQDLKTKLKRQRTPEQVLDVIKTYLKEKNAQFTQEDVENLKRNSCGKKTVRFANATSGGGRRRKVIK